MRGNAVGQLLKPLEPRQLGMAKLNDFRPVISPANDSAQGNCQYVHQLVALGAPHTRVGHFT